METAYIDACAHYLSDVVNILEKLSVGAVTRLSWAWREMRYGAAAFRPYFWASPARYPPEHNMIDVPNDTRSEVGVLVECRSSANWRCKRPPCRLCIIAIARTASDNRRALVLLCGYHVTATMRPVNPGFRMIWCPEKTRLACLISLFQAVRGRSQIGNAA